MNIKKIAITVCLAVALFIIIFLAGCRVVWTDDMFAAGLFTDFQAKDSVLTSEPNMLIIRAGRIDSETDDLRIRYNPYTGVELSTK